MMVSAGEAGRVLDPGILREYDIRGVVGETLTEEDVTAIGRAFGTIVARQGGRGVAVGYDGRLSSPLLEKAVVSGLVAAGVDVWRVGLGPSPMLYFATHVLEADAGLMITGSHNPPEYNGIKMVIGEQSFFGADIQRLGELAATGDFTAGEGRTAERPVADDYVRRLLEGFRGRASAQRRLGPRERCRGRGDPGIVHPTAGPPRASQRKNRRYLSGAPPGSHR